MSFTVNSVVHNDSFISTLPRKRLVTYLGRELKWKPDEYEIIDNGGNENPDDDNNTAMELEELPDDSTATS